MLWPATVSAQVDTGTISGLVTDSTGGIIPAAEVTIVQTDTNSRVTVTSNQTGFYSLPSLHPGHYSISAAKSGFQTQNKTGIELRVQDRLEVNFALGLGSTSTELTVTGAQTLLESETSSLGQVIEQKTIVDLPLNGRNFIQLATLTAGTLPSTRTQERDNSISNGARAVQNSYLLDGIDNKNRILGFAGSSAQIIQPIIDAIEEFKVQTSTFSAEFGQAAGGVVNVTMRSGTNSFHGNVFEFLRNSAVDATPYFQPAGGQQPFFPANQPNALRIHAPTFPPQQRGPEFVSRTSARFTGQLTNSVLPPQKTRYTCTIYMPRCCTNLDSITRNSPTATSVVIFGLQMWLVTW